MALPSGFIRATFTLSFGANSGVNSKVLLSGLLLAFVHCRTCSRVWFTVEYEAMVHKDSAAYKPATQDHLDWLSSRVAVSNDPTQFAPETKPEVLMLQFTVHVEPFPAVAILYGDGVSSVRCLPFLHSFPLR
jgi:hypothetical protein